MGGDGARAVWPTWARCAVFGVLGAIVVSGVALALTGAGLPHAALRILAALQEHSGHVLREDDRGWYRSAPEARVIGTG